MKLSPTIRFRPFSHVSGTMCLLPGSHLAFQCFMELVCIFDYSKASPHVIGAIRFSDLGTLKEFTVLQDIERAEIIVSGFSSTGFIRYVIRPQTDPRSWVVEFEKLARPIAASLVKKDDREMQETLSIKQGDIVSFLYNDKPSEPLHLPAPERLFLGVDKSQDWDMVVRRKKLEEYLPYLYALSQTIPESTLDEIPRLGIEELFQAAFSHMMIPRLVDTGFHGFMNPIVSNINQSPLGLFSQIYKQARAQFFMERDALWHIVKPAFVSGTLANITTKRGHVVSLEWTKHTIRRVEITPAADDEITIHFQNDVKRFRANNVLYECPAVITLRKDSILMLDNFLK